MISSRPDPSLVKHLLKHKSFKANSDILLQVNPTITRHVLCHSMSFPYR